MSDNFKPIELLQPAVPAQNRKDFTSDQEVRWCPGCGDYSILAQMQKLAPELGIARENIVFISGIGCSSRFPYYMDTYGIHSIHGRAPTLASGLKIARPDLHVFIITGDGDGFSIGGNHMLHILRRNINVTIVLFNNRIYGLTKGQYSPTSLTGAKTKSSPMGTVEQPLNPLSVALAAEATFVARSVDTEIKHLGEVLRRAAEHKGASFVEVFQNCNIFNDGAWDHVKEAATKKDNTLQLEHGKPMIFGAQSNKAVWMNPQTWQPEVIELAEGDTRQPLVHDENRPDASLAYMLSRMQFPECPVPLGVLRCVQRPVYEDGIAQQVKTAQKAKGTGDLRSLYLSSDVWTVSSDGSENHPLKGTSGNRAAAVDEVVKEMMKGWADTFTNQQCLASTTPVGELKLSAAVTVASGTSLLATLQAMKSANSDVSLVLKDDGTLAGVFRPADAIRVSLLANDPSLVTIDQCLYQEPIVAHKGSSVTQAIHLLAQAALSSLPVVDEDRKPLGMFTFELAEQQLAIV
jgi:2-oxoglutarate/2-oxoacid ferredoxin oxidoreductase subunit beta